MRINTSINQIPYLGNSVTIFMTVILNDNSFNQITITSLKVLYGRVILHQPNRYIAQDVIPTAILVTGSLMGNEYTGIFYTNAILQPIIPDNFTRLVQKIPLGIFNDTSTNSIVGQDMKARALMLDDYYRQYNSVQDLVYSFDYSPELEYQFNNTIGLLSNSAYPDNLFLWFRALNNAALNSYDLELALSQYIFYRIGISSPVFIDDGITTTVGVWNLGVPGYTELGETTILGDATPSVHNLKWKIYNSNTFTPQFKIEITDLIIRISRADVGNEVTFSNVADPTTDGFILIGYTYKNDPRILYGKCTQFLGIDQYPLNILGFKLDM